MLGDFNQALWRGWGLAVGTKSLLFGVKGGRDLSSHVESGPEGWELEEGALFFIAFLAALSSGAGLVAV